MQSVHHWNVLAEHEADQIAKSLTGKGFRLYLDSSPENSTFETNFRQLLTSQLVQKGLPVSKSDRNALTVSYDVGVVRHLNQDAPGAFPSKRTILLSGISVASLVTGQSVDHWSEVGRMLLPLSAIDDLTSAQVSHSDTEVVITTQVSRGDLIIHSSSNIYFIDSKNAAHFFPREKRNSGRTVKVSS